MAFSSNLEHERFKILVKRVFFSTYGKFRMFTKPGYSLKIICRKAKYICYLSSYMQTYLVTERSKGNIIICMVTVFDRVTIFNSTILHILNYFNISESALC